LIVISVSLFDIDKKDWLLFLQIQKKEKKILSKRGGGGEGGNVIKWFNKNYLKVVFQKSNSN